jgi:methylthioribose-1-phosphate isomerase
MALTSIRTNEDDIEIIDQLLLPHSEVWIKIESPEDAYEAIKKMKIRGAPAIASLAALSVASYLSRASKANPVPDYLGSLSSLQSHLSVILSHLYSSRPTAVNLGAAVKRLNNILKVAVEENWSVDDTVQGLISEARAVADEDVGRNKTMSRLGADWILRQAEEKGVDLTNGVNVLTVCNTGSLATSVSLGASRSSHERRPVPFPLHLLTRAANQGYGTALGIITRLHEIGKLKRA